MFVLTSLLDFFLPRICPGCGSTIGSSNSFACDKCLQQITRADADILKNEYCKKFSHYEIISDFASLYIFEKEGVLQQVIHSLKYGNRFITGKLLGQLVARELSDKINSWNADFLIPVPLYHVKKAERGYNQSEFICRGISAVTDLPVKCRILKRVRFTETQTQLNMIERRKNVENAFRLKKASVVKGEKIILVDDVVTTGSTIGECGKVLIENGASKVFALSVALAS